MTNMKLRENSSEMLSIEEILVSVMAALIFSRKDLNGEPDTAVRLAVRRARSIRRVVKQLSLPPDGAPKGDQD